MKQSTRGLEGGLWNLFGCFSPSERKHFQISKQETSFKEREKDIDRTGKIKNTEIEKIGIGRIEDNGKITRR
jgi:hypothetical protein